MPQWAASPHGGGSWCSDLAASFQPPVSPSSSSLAAVWRPLFTLLVIDRWHAGGGLTGLVGWCHMCPLQQHKAVTTSALAQMLPTLSEVSDASSRCRSLAYWVFGIRRCSVLPCHPRGLGCLTSCVSVCSQNEGPIVQPHWEAGFLSRPLFKTGLELLPRRWMG